MRDSLDAVILRPDRDFPYCPRADPHRCLVGPDSHFKLTSIESSLLEFQMSGFEHWLEEHGLGKYTELFVDNEIGLEVLTELEEAVAP